MFHTDYNWMTGFKNKFKSLKKKEDIKLKEIAMQTTIKSQEKKTKREKNIASFWKFKLIAISTFMYFSLARFTMQFIVRKYMNGLENECKKQIKRNSFANCNKKLERKSTDKKHCTLFNTQSGN